METGAGATAARGGSEALILEGVPAMKPIAIMAIVGVAILVLGATAWTGRAYAHGGYRHGGWTHAGPAVDRSPASQPDADAGGAIYQHQCGHWWGWPVRGHRARCRTWNYVAHSRQRPGRSLYRGCW